MPFQVYSIANLNLGELCHRSSSASKDNGAGRSSEYSCKIDGKVSLSMIVCDLLMVAGSKLRNSTVMNFVKA